MKILRTTVITLTCVLAAGMGAAAADTGKRAYGGTPHYYGHMGMMGPGYGSMMGHGQGWMMGPHQGWMGHGPMMGHGYGPMMGYGHGPMMGYGRMMSPGQAHMWSGARMDPDQLSDDDLDRMGERIAERHQTMQEIAAEQDKAARRDLVREYLKDRQTQRQGKYWTEDADDGDDLSRRGYGYGYGRMMGQGPGSGMGPGMMGQGSGGAMGPGMMGPGMMGPGSGGGMGLGMMDPGQLSDEQLDRLAEHMAENHERMQRLAATSDKTERRDLLREHFDSMQELMASMRQNR